MKLFFLHIATVNSLQILISLHCLYDEITEKIIASKNYILISYMKRNKLMYNVTKEIHNLNNLCISSDEKEQRIQEFEQLNHSIAYTSTVLHFFWKEDIMVSYKRDERYTIVEMLCKFILLIL